MKTDAEHNQLKLSDLANNALQKLFEQEMPKVLENLYNGNTQAKKARTIDFKLKFVPVDESREVVTMTVTAKSSLAPCNDISTNLYVDMDKNGNIFAAEIGGQIAGQIALYDDDGDGQTESKITDVSTYKNRYKA